jgi:hypothetical protein
MDSLAECWSYPATRWKTPMAKSKVILPRDPPRRALTKKQALRHLIHAAVRMISSGEDPFATHILIQSADKLLIDLAKRSDKSLSFRWDDPKIIKPEFRDALIEVHRETFNFFKHADLDHDKALHVGDIAMSNVLQLGACVVNYHGLFAEMTDHMHLAWSLARLVFPKGFVMEAERSKFDEAALSFANEPLSEYLLRFWNDPLFRQIFHKLAEERAADLQDMLPFYSARFSEFSK